VLDGLSIESRFRHERRNIPWVNLNVDVSYQRDLSPSKVAKIARIFDPDAFGYLIVGQRADGTYWLVDGQHRWKAMQEIGWTDQLVPCLVLVGTTPESEAQLYDLYNGNRGMPRIAERFKARLRHGDPEATQIKRVVTDLGYELWFGRGKCPRGQIAAINALLVVHRTGKPGDLMKVLTICRELWGDDPHGVAGDLILGMFAFTNRYRDQFELEKLIERLQGVSPVALLNRGRQIVEVLGYSNTRVGVARAILKAYNENKRTNRLPEWVETEHS
jgi:hypothetical protein